MSVSRVVLTPGEPAGIGPDLVIQLVQKTLPVEVVAVASSDLLKQRAHDLNLPLTLIDYDASLAPKVQDVSTLLVINQPLAEPCKAGKLNVHNAPYVLKTLTRAAQGCLTHEFAALVTGPVHKEIINRAGVNFQGHTEFLADISQVKRVVMMLANPKLRVALVTTHIPLSAVPANIQQDDLTQVIQILQKALQTYFKIKNPCIYVTGLNPHAGEGGVLGREEIDVIEPVLNRLNQQGLNLVGPLSADTLFVPEHLKHADAVLAMYHDQGLPVIKALGFKETVNITLGLPFIRTSVGHGTALELAGTGKASVDSLRYAVGQAAQLC